MKYYTTPELFAELHRIADLLNKNTVSYNDLTEHGRISKSPYKLRWGTFANAVAAAGLVPTPTWNNGLRYKNTKPYKKKSPFTRRRVSSTLKLAILKRDRYKCVLCGATPAVDPTVELHIDHIKPVAIGGRTTQWNLWVLCSKCNFSKSDSYEPELYWFAARYLTEKFFERCV